MATGTTLRSLAAQPLWRRWTLAAFFARLPLTMTLLALVLAGEQATGSLAVGAQLAGVATLTAGVAAPLRGRRLDRFELRSGLQRTCLASAAVYLAQALALAAGAPLAMLFALAALGGFVAAALSGGFRALLVPVVPPGDLARANALEAVFIEVAFVSGPAVAGLVAALTGATGVLLAMAGALLTAAVISRGLPEVPPSAGHTAPPPWRTPGVRPVYLLALALGLCIGLIESAVPARVVELGTAATSSGLLLALIAFGSAAGGLVVGGRLDLDLAPQRPAALLLLGLAALIAPAALATSVPLLAGTMLVLGLPIAPLNALGAIVLQSRVPPSRMAEGFAVYTAAILVGAGLGQNVTGLLLESTGARPLLAAAAAVPLCAAVAVAAVGRRRQRLFAAR